VAKPAREYFGVAEERALVVQVSRPRDSLEPVEVECDRKRMLP
jgi:hypothetical protein